MNKVAKRLNPFGVVTERLNLLIRVSRLIQKELAVLLSFQVVFIGYATDLVRSATELRRHFTRRRVMLFNRRQWHNFVTERWTNKGGSDHLVSRLAKPRAH